MFLSFITLLLLLPLSSPQPVSDLPSSLVDLYSSLAVGFDDVLDKVVLERVKEEVETYNKSGDIYER